LALKVSDNFLEEEMVQRRTVLLGMAMLPLSGAVGTGMVVGEDRVGAEIIPTSGGDLVVHPVNHASMVLEWGGKAIYVDPVGGAELYADLPKADAILITHGHGDHFDVKTLTAIAGSASLITNQEVYDLLPADLKANATALANGEEGRLVDVPLRAIAAHNTTPDRMNFHPVGVGNGYVLTFGDALIYVAGDTEPTEDMLGLTGITAAFVPMNLPYTMTPAQALDAVNTFKPKIVYPYHYGKSDLSPFETGLADGIELRMLDWY
jgi:L-ascorbate metabolism protein UlaG (beta-lactamase superfamily)